MPSRHDKAGPTLPADPAMTHLQERLLPDGSPAPYLSRPTSASVDALDQALAPGVTSGSAPVTAVTRKAPARRPSPTKLPPGAHGGITIPEPIAAAGVEWTDTHAEWSPIGAALALETVKQET